MPYATRTAFFLLATAAASAVFGEANPFRHAAQRNYQGYFENQDMQFHCHAVGDACVGRISWNDKTVPFRARGDVEELRGEYQDGQHHFDFSATINGDTLTFTTDGHSESLKRIQLRPWSGYWVGKHVRVAIRKLEPGCDGTIEFAERKYPFAGQIAVGVLRGRFRSGATEFPFELQKNKGHLAFLCDAYKELVYPEPGAQQKQRLSRDYAVWKQARKDSIQSAIVIAPRWKALGRFHEGLAVVRNHAGKCGFIDPAGQEVIRPTWENAKRFSQGLAPVQSNETFTDDSGDKPKTGRKWGYIDRGGRLVIPAKLADAQPFSDNRALVKVFQDWFGFQSSSSPFAEIVPAFIDPNGATRSVASNGGWNRGSRFSEGLAKAISQQRPIFGETRQGQGFLNGEFQFVIEPKFSQARDFSQGLAAVEDEQGQWGFVDKAGKYVIPPRWADAQSFSEGLAIVTGENGLKGAIDRTGRVVIPLQWKVLLPFSDGLACAMDQKGAKGHLKPDGTPLHGFGTWKFVGPFKEGISAVSRDGRDWGLIDTSGRIVCPMVWRYICSCGEGLCAIQNHNGDWGLLLHPLRPPPAAMQTVRRLGQPVRR